MPSRIWLGAIVLSYLTAGICFLAKCVIFALREDAQVAPQRWNGPHRRSTVTLAVIVAILLTVFWIFFFVYAGISSFIEDRRA